MYFDKQTRKNVKPYFMIRMEKGSIGVMELRKRVRKFSKRVGKLSKVVRELSKWVRKLSKRVRELAM